MALSEFLAAVWLTAGAVSVALTMRLLAQHARLRDDHARVIALASELAHVRSSQARLDAIQDQLADSIDASSQAVRSTHRAISDIPFAILEQIPATRAGARQVRRVHDLATDGIYAGLSLYARWRKKRRLGAAGGSRPALPPGGTPPPRD